jgi:hypothetical protein
MQQIARRFDNPDRRRDEILGQSVALFDAD